MSAEGKPESLESSQSKVRIIDEHDEELDFLLAVAVSTPKKRFTKPLHEPWEHENRMLNAVLQESYIRPHKHLSPHSVDTVQALKGIFNVVIFDDQGEVSESIMITGRKIVSISPEVWHTVIARTPCVIYQTTGHDEGGYDFKTHKTYPDWAPMEGTKEAVSYLEELKLKIEYLNEAVDPFDLAQGQS